MNKSQSLSLETRKGKFNPHLAANVLIDTLFMTDEEAAEKWGVTDRSIRNWRNLLETDLEFSAIFLHKRELFESEWKSEINAALRAGIEFFKRVFQTADETRADVIYSAAGAFKILSDAHAAMDLLDAKLSDFNRSAREADRQMAAETANEDTAR